MSNRLSVDQRRVPVPLDSDPTTARRQVREARRRRARRRRAIALVLTLVAGLLVGLEFGRRAWQDASGSQAVTPAAGLATAGAPAVDPAPSVVAPTAPPVVPTIGGGTFAFSTDTGAVVGAAGVLRRYRVAAENGTGQDVAAFALEVDQILSDPRGWTAGAQVRLQRVSGTAAAEFIIYLASAGTSQTMCAAGGLHTAGYTSCRLAGKVIINLSRWTSAVPGYGAPLPDYRAYALNHEVGHELGHGHEACPAAGALAPVMQQQTLGLRGCMPNAWPYLNGQRYSGPEVP